MTDDIPAKPVVIRKRSIPDRLRYASQTLLKVVDQIANGTPGDHCGTLIGTSFTLDQTADEIEQQQADTASEYLALAQHTDTTCEAAAALARVRALHAPVQHMGQTWCGACSLRRTTGPKSEEWVAFIPHPCPTLGALDTAQEA
ncbi:MULTISPECIES: hypothetical protein [Streptomyces]|uniref:hypothetical protein n=1 Tax=Streptomyces TaxID=1883 RepID=UPI0004CCFBB7|nr:MULTISPECIES: hypothetical protein [Streptomyces]KOT57072.1 hypothetical protein ADK43_21815 [Streptomyces rimosus subsp. rimosus]